MRDTPRGGSRDTAWTLGRSLSPRRAMIPVGSACLGIRIRTTAPVIQGMSPPVRIHDDTMHTSLRINHGHMSWISGLTWMKRTKTISHRAVRSFPPGIGIADNLPSRLGIVHLMRPLSGVGNIMAINEGITLSPRR